MFTETLVRAAKTADLMLARGHQRWFGEKNSLVVLLFHAIVRNEEDLDQNILNPRYCVTVAQVRACIEYYLGHGFVAVSPQELLAGLRPNGRHVLFTFDDGYFNNTYVLPVLEACRVPALFAIATDHVQLGKAFWWDVLYRHRLPLGSPASAIWKEADELMPRAVADIEQELLRQFGKQALEPVADLDRPFRPSELRAFARHSLVHLANHTAGHEYLPSCAPDVVATQISAAQDALLEITGVRPTVLAYPYGGVSDAVVRIAQQEGLQLGFTTTPGKQTLPLEVHGDQCMRIPRFAIYRGVAIEGQCERVRFDWRLSWRIRHWWRRCFGSRQVPGRV